MKYLYRFVELEEFPEYDKEKYPFAVLTMSYDPVENSVLGDFHLWLFSNEPTLDGNNYLFVRGGYLTDYVKSLYQDSWRKGWYGQDYALPEEKEWYVLHRTSVIWTNFNLLCDGGEVYFKASEPIPVYE